MATKLEQQLEIQKRVDAIILALSKGYSTYREIYSFAESQGWGVSTRTVDSYIQRAHRQMEAIIFRKFGNTQDYAITNFNKLLQQALQRNELDLAFKIMKEVFKIAGAYDEVVQQVNVTTAKLSPDQLSTKLEAIRERENGKK